jgi:hypothetical protein
LHCCIVSENALLTAHFSVTELPTSMADSERDIWTGAVVAGVVAGEELMLNTVPQPPRLGVLPGVF